VVHGHPEDLTWAGQPLAIEGVANPAGAVTAAGRDGSASTANTVSADAPIMIVALTLPRS
jgi:hypothetical protein